MTTELHGKPIAITGASSGIGRATAFACAKAGMPVALAARRLDKLESVVNQIRADGGSAIAVRVDVTIQSACKHLIDRTIEEFGPIHAVFANAGYGLEKSVETTSDEEIREIFETNLWGSLNVLRPALAALRAQGAGGHLLMCSSSLSKIGVPYFAAYSATKAAQDHFGRALRLELTGTNIAVSTIHPIGTKTELWEVLEKRSGGNTLFSSRTPASFMQPAEKVANAIVTCLRKPRGEVWTSLPTRVVLGLATIFPGTTDAIFRIPMRKMLAKQK